MHNEKTFQSDATLCPMFGRLAVYAFREYCRYSAVMAAENQLVRFLFPYGLMFYSVYCVVCVLIDVIILCGL